MYYLVCHILRKLVTKCAGYILLSSTNVYVQEVYNIKSNKECINNSSTTYSRRDYGFTFIEC